MSQGGIFGGHFGSVENEGGGGGGGGGVTTVAIETTRANPGSTEKLLEIRDPTGPTVLVSQSIAAGWDIGAIRIFAVDKANGNDANLGYATSVANPNATQYQAATAAAGLVAKKTFAGLASVFPKSGAGRKAIIRVAAGDYVESIEVALNHVSGYAADHPQVIGTVTNATSGSVAFAGTAADLLQAGMVTGLAMNAAGYNPTGASTVRSIQCLKVGGAAPAFASDPAAPVGYRIRFGAAAPTQAGLRNAVRYVRQTFGTDQLIVDRDLVVAPVSTDVFYLEQPGVSFGTECFIVGDDPPLTGGSLGSGMLLNGLHTGPTHNFSWEMTDVSVEMRNCGCGFLDIEGGSLVTDGVRCDIGSSLRFTRAMLGDFYSFDTTNLENLPALTILAGSVLQQVKLLNFRGIPTRNTDAGPATDIYGQTNIGHANFNALETEVPSRIIGKNGGDSPLILIWSDATFGEISIDQSFSQPAIRFEGKCNAIFAGLFDGQANNNDVMLDFTDAQQCTVNFLSRTTFGWNPATAAAALGDIRLRGGTGPIVSFDDVRAEEIYDPSGNHLFVGGSYDYGWALSPSASHGANNTGATIPAYSLVTVQTGGADFRFKKADLSAAADPTFGGLFGVLGAAVPDGSPGIVAGFCGAKAVLFDGTQALGKIAYLSATAGVATCTPPGLRVPIGIVIAAAAPLQNNMAVVRIGFPAETPGQAAITLADQFRMRFLSLNPSTARPPRVSFDDLDFPDYAGAPWDHFGAFGTGVRASHDSPYGHCVVCDAPGAGQQNVMHVYNGLSLPNQRALKWHFGGAAFFKGTVAANELRGFGFVNSTAIANIRGLSMFVGLAQDISATHFSVRLADAGALTASAISTIAYSAAFHVLEMWFDGSTVWGSIDFEPPFLVTSTVTDMPDGQLWQWHGNIEGTSDIFLDAVGVSSERGAA